MLLDLSKLHGRREHFERTFQPSLFEPQDPDYRVAVPVDVSFDVEKSGPGIFRVTGRAVTRLNVECGRCLEPFLQPFELKFNLLLNNKQSTGIEWVDDEDQGVEDYQALLGPDVTEVPLNAIIAEQVVLNYNLHPLPDVDAAGRCVQCGRPAVVAPVPKKEVGVDPRWAKLGNLKDISGQNGSDKPKSGK